MGPAPTIKLDILCSLLLSTWSSFYKNNRFYNNRCLSRVTPSVARTVINGRSGVQIELEFRSVGFCDIIILICTIVLCDVPLKVLCNQRVKFYNQERSWLNFRTYPYIHIEPHTLCIRSMCVVLCFATKKQQKQRIVPQLLHCFCHYFR